MPSPSENRAMDIIMAAFPGSEVITPDNTQRLKKPDKVPIDDGWGGWENRGPTKPKPPPKERRFKPGTKRAGDNQEGMF